MKPKRERYQNRIELLQGTLDMLILQTLQWGPQHGYGISQSIRGRSGEVLQVEHVERALKQLNAILIAFCFWFHGCRQSTSLAVECQLLFGGFQAGP